MEIYTEKHLNRVERYIRGTYYLDHLSQKEQVIWKKCKPQNEWIVNFMNWYVFVNLSSFYVREPLNNGLRKMT